MLAISLRYQPSWKNGFIISIHVHIAGSDIIADSFSMGDEKITRSTVIERGLLKIGSLPAEDWTCKVESWEEYELSAGELRKIPSIMDKISIPPLYSNYLSTDGTYCLLSFDGGAQSISLAYNTEAPDKWTGITELHNFIRDLSTKYDKSLDW